MPYTSTVQVPPLGVGGFVSFCPRKAIKLPIESAVSSSVWGAMHV